VRFGGRNGKLAPDPELIRALAKLLEETGLTEIEYSAGDQRIHVARHVAAPAAPALAAITQLPAEKPSALNGANGVDHSDANGVEHPGTLKAPLVGIAYLAAEPGNPPYVRIGDTVTQGQTLLIIEAMKVMNQIRAPQSGRVSHVYIHDAEPVEYGTALMLIE
jgi:acetyl-CoA carboxylase biotin carboxyl carrier protein